MPNRKEKYYIGEIITFRGVWKINGVEQTPDADSGKVKIWSQADTTTPVVAETSAPLAANQIQYQYTIAQAGVFTLFFTAEFENGADKRKAAIEFVVSAEKSY